MNNWLNQIEEYMIEGAVCVLRSTADAFFFYLFVFLIKDSRAPSAWLSLLCFTDEFCSGVYNQYELFV
jgi:hypothetical protein